MNFRRLTRSFLKTAAAIAAAAVLAVAPLAPAAHAQNDSAGPMDQDGGDSGAPSMPQATPSAGDASRLSPMNQMHIGQPITGSMMVTPPYGNAPLRVGFFVLADDPEGFGFLTYSWNFGDGTVSSLPPELYIFHTYHNPGTYLCSLVIKTVDGRSKTFMQGVVVKPRGD